MASDSSEIYGNCTVKETCSLQKYMRMYSTPIIRRNSNGITLRPCVAWALSQCTGVPISP